jgi:hypothetical protein
MGILHLHKDIDHYFFCQFAVEIAFKIIPENIAINPTKKNITAIRLGRKGSALKLMNWYTEYSPADRPMIVRINPPTPK